MATYVNDLRLKEIGTGESSGTWGTETNVNLELIGDAMGYATKSIANASTATITMPDGTASNGELRSLYLKLTGGGQACTVTLGPNTVNKVWIVENATSYTLTFSMGSGANVAVGAGLTKVIAGDGAGSGADILDVLKNMSLGGDLAISGTFNPTGDTASGDDAAFGYASADGAILTGQGSTSDVTLKNDADGTVLTIPTGTTNVDIVGTATAATFEPDGDTAAGDNAAIGYTSAEGLILTGQGSTNDVTIKNDADADVIEIPTGTVNVTVAGDLVAAGTLQATGDTASGDDAAIGYTAAEGLILTGQGSTNDVTIKNDADAAVLQIPTGTVNTTLAGTLGVAGGSTNGVVISQGDIALKNGGTQSTIKFYCETSNAHYAQLQAPPHSAFSGNVTLTLPATSDTLAGIAATQTLSNKTLAHPLISGDTAAGDDAALGYTSAEGLILTGQGSTSDVTIKNDADAAALTVPTGTTNVSVVGDLLVGGSITDSGAAVKVAGLETIYVPAAAMYPESTNGCSDIEQVELSNGPELKCLDFAAAADDFAQFQVIFPKSWNEGTVTFQAFFTVTGTNTGTVAWGLAGRSFADSADLNTAFGTQVVATAKAHSGTSNDIDVAAVSGAVTIAGAAADCLTIFQIARDVSADSQSGAARLLGIKLFFTTDAKNDA